MYGNIYINESTDDDVDYNIMMLQATGGGNAYRPVMVDDKQVSRCSYIDAVNTYLTGIITATT